jgi:hypothetical protein
MPVSEPATLLRKGFAMRAKARSIAALFLALLGAVVIGICVDGYRGTDVGGGDGADRAWHRYA